jgi:hypothetical protein
VNPGSVSVNPNGIHRPRQRVDPGSGSAYPSGWGGTEWRTSGGPPGVKEAVVVRYLIRGATALAECTMYQRT